jgi:hypothetical protein
MSQTVINDISPEMMYKNATCGILGCRTFASSVVTLAITAVTATKSTRSLYMMKSNAQSVVPRDLRGPFV